MDEAFPSFPFPKPNSGKQTINEEDQRTFNEQVQRSQQEILLSLLSMPGTSTKEPGIEEQIMQSLEPQLSFPPLATEEDTHDDLTPNSALEPTIEELVSLFPSQPESHPLKVNTKESKTTSSWEMDTPSSPTVMVATPISMLNMHSAYQATNQLRPSTNDTIPIQPLMMQAPKSTTNQPKAIWLLLAIASMIAFTIIFSASYLISKNVSQANMLDNSSINHSPYSSTIKSTASNSTMSTPATQPTTKSSAQTTLIPLLPTTGQAVSSQKATATQPLAPAQNATLAPVQTATSASQASVSYEAEAPDNTRDGTKTFSCNLCSGGVRVGWINNDVFLQFNNINVNHDGDYTLTLYYLNSIANRVTSAYISINGGPNAMVPDIQVSQGNCCDNFPPQITQMTIYLQAGKNTIKISNPTGNAPDIDRIVIG